MSDKRYQKELLYEFSRDIFTSLGFKKTDSEVAADSLVRAELEGAGSHGVSRLAIYAQRISEGRIAATPNIHIDQSGYVFRVDGGNGLGQVVSSQAIQAAIPAAKESGIAAVFIRNSNHFGTAAFYCQMVSKSDMALMTMTNSPPGIPPWGGKQAFFGTNPIAFGFPTRSEPPVIVDMSSSVVARGKIILADKQGKSIPEGWAIDQEGEGTTDPAEALKGAVLPLGGAKGYALAMAVEIMSGVMSQAAYGWHVNNLYKEGDPPANVGHCFILLDINKWMPMDTYYDAMEQFLQEVKEVPLANNVEEILYPGERRYRTYLENSEHGIILPDEVVQELERLGQECGIPFLKD